MNMPKPKDKPFVIPKSMVWEAYRRVAANKGAPGVDGQALDEFEADLRDNLYRIWNRMSSGSYFPPPVRAVEIPKPHGGGVRVLGVPTISDRIAQTVVAMQSGAVGGAEVPPRLLWLPAGKSALEAVGTCRRRCWEFDWIIDLGCPEVLRHRSLGPRGQSGAGGHRLLMGAAVCEAVARCPAAAPGWHAC